MSYISDKFNVPAETVKKMMQKGIISCQWDSYEEVYRLRQQGKSMGDIAIITGYSKASVHSILDKFKKL